MDWVVEFHPDYVIELEAESRAVQKSVAKLIILLRQSGPQLSRPWCDTLKGSRYPNLKELRFSLPDGEWRIAFAFDPKRQAVLFVGGSKSGKNEGQFYRDLIRVAEQRFHEHLSNLDRRQGDGR